MHVKKYDRKNEFVKNVWPANSALFIYVSIHCVETVKDDFYSKIPTKNFFYFLPICSIKYA